MRESLAKPLLLVRHHAACEDNGDLWAFPFQTNERVQLAGNLVLRGLADDAGVENNDVRRVLISRRRVARLLKRSGDLGTIGLVHLTADCPDMESLTVAGQARRRRGGFERNRRTLRVHETGNTPEVCGETANIGAGIASQRTNGRVYQPRDRTEASICVQNRVVTDRQRGGGLVESAPHLRQRDGRGIRVSRSGDSGLSRYSFR